MTNIYIYICIYTCICCIDWSIGFSQASTVAHTHTRLDHTFMGYMQYSLSHTHDSCSVSETMRNRGRMSNELQSDRDK